MKRIYIAVIFLIFSFTIGIIEYITVNHYTDSFLNVNSNTEKLVKKNKIKEAEKLSRKNAESFDRISKNYLYCYYQHDKLEEISEELYKLEDLLDDNRIDDFHEESHYLNKKLLSIKEKEQITIQNIL